LEAPEQNTPGNPDGALVPAIPGVILAGPDDSIFDDIFDWIANAVAVITSAVIDWINRAWSAITTTVTSWISWLWNSISPWLTWLGDLISSIRETVVSWISTKVGELWSWITTSISNIITTVGAWFIEQWARISSLVNTVLTTLGEWWSNLWANISSWFTDLWTKLESWFTWLGEFIRDQVVKPMATWWDEFLEKLLDVGSWIGSLLDGIATWLQEDIPGHSPRWHGFLKSIWDAITSWFAQTPEYWEERLTPSTAFGLIHLLRPIGDMFNEIFETFMDAIMGLVRSIGPTNPSIAIDSYSAMAKVGMMSLGGLAGMTIAGETLNPISHLGLGHISAMIYDMTNYKLITGVFMGALTFAMLKQPLSYYFNEMFRPYVLSPMDFMELMSRDAFRHPELLQEPDLLQSVNELTGGQGSAWEGRMIGYYGYPAQYHGLFRELSHARLGYFALAGIARTGFWDEAWFIEALARTGYSVTARDALLRMYQEQVKYARQQPVMYHLRRLAREGYYTVAKVKEVLAEVNEMESLDDIRIMAMGLEQEYETFDMTLDISLRSFSRGVISESECRKNLAGLNIPVPLVDTHLAREKLGIIRRITWTAPETVPATQYVEE